MCVFNRVDYSLCHGKRQSTTNRLSKLHTMNGRVDGSLLEMVNRSDYSVATKMPRKIRLMYIVVLFLVAIILVVVGISLIVLSSIKSCKGESEDEYCSFSTEAKRVGLDDFLSRVQRSYFKLHPHKSYHDPQMGEEEVEAMIKAYRPYNPSPQTLKDITDTSLALLKQLNGMKIKVDKLKQREKKVLVQAKHYLQHTFGQPYDVNYYAGDWMFGPNQFCWQSVCSIGSDIFYHLDYFKPENLEGLKTLREKLKEHADGIYQYISNMKEGVKRGMVRSVEDCTTGVDAVRQQYLNISLHNETGVLKSWFMQFVLSPDFLSSIPKEDQEHWFQSQGMYVNESVNEDFVEFIGKPIAELIRYLEKEHIRHCVPSSVSSGLSKLPLDNVYLDGVKTNIKTNKTLPTGEPLKGTKTYQMIVSYFTTNNMTADEIYDLGVKQVQLLYPQVLEIAQNVTKIDNVTEAVKKFRELLTDRSNYFNDEPFPKNESDKIAHAKCSYNEGAREFCPKRWEAAQKWWSAARMAMSLLDPKTINMFYFTGKKHTTPSCPVNLEPDLNPSHGAQSYLETNKECTGGAAVYSVPFFLDNAGPRFSEWSVNAHEARPGHHTQVQGYVEHFQDNCEGTVSWLDKETYYTAFVEGWGLYAENPLVSETDVYDSNLMQKYGMLKWQIWRALRLVVDSGIHSKNLTRSQALALFDKYAWDNSDIAKKEVTRYQSAFGQATAYMIGRLRLKELREYVKEKLGSRFNLKEFHYQALSQGSSPLAYLTSHIHKYVDCELSNRLDGCDHIRFPPKKPSEPQERKYVAGQMAKPEHPKIHHRHYL